MTRVQQHRYVRSRQPHLMRHRPARLMVTSTVNRYHRHSRLFQPLDIPDPQTRIGIHRIFDQDPFKISIHQFPISNGVCYRLHSKWIGRRPRSDPQIVHSRLQRFGYMFRCGHFGRYRQPQTQFHFLQPYQTFFAYTLKRVRARARLPCACAIDKRNPARLFELARGLYYLLSALRRTGT